MVRKMVVAASDPEQSQIEFAADDFGGDFDFNFLKLAAIVGFYTGPAGEG